MAFFNLPGKYQVGKNPLQREKELKEMRSTESTQTKNVIQFYEKRIQETESELARLVGGNAVAEAKRVSLKATLSAYNVKKEEVSNSDLDQRFQTEYVKDFNCWLQGTSAYNKDLNKTPWGNKPLRDKSTVAYINQRIRAKAILERKLTEMKVIGPRSIEENWLYFKYIVCPDKWLELDFLSDWNYFMPGGDKDEGGRPIPRDKAAAENRTAMQGGDPGPACSPKDGEFNISAPMGKNADQEKQIVATTIEVEDDPSEVQDQRVIADVNRSRNSNNPEGKKEALVPSDPTLSKEEKYTQFIVSSVAEKNKVRKLVEKGDPAEARGEERGVSENGARLASSHKQFFPVTGDFPELSNSEYSDAVKLYEKELAKNQNQPQEKFGNMEKLLQKKAVLDQMKKERDGPQLSDLHKAVTEYRHMFNLAVDNSYNNEPHHTKLETSKRFVAIEADIVEAEANLLTALRQRTLRLIAKTQSNDAITRTAYAKDAMLSHSHSQKMVENMFSESNNRLVKLVRDYMPEAKNENEIETRVYRSAKGGEFPLFKAEDGREYYMFGNSRVYITEKSKGTVITLFEKKK